MIPLQVIVDREIRFTSISDLPVGFRRALAGDNTIPNPLAGKKGAPATVESYYHNPFTKEVALPRGYWPQFLARAEEFGVELQVTELREEYPLVINRQVSVAVSDLTYGLDTLRTLLAGALPVDWETVQLRLIVTKHLPLTQQEGAPTRVVQLEPKPFPWEESTNGVQPGPSAGAGQGGNPHP